MELFTELFKPEFIEEALKLGNYSGCRWQGLACEGEADGLDGADAAASGGLDDGADVCVVGSGPFGSEAVGDFAVDRARPQAALGAVIGGLDVAIFHEDEQTPPPSLDCAL